MKSNITESRHGLVPSLVYASHVDEMLNSFHDRTSQASQRRVNTDCIGVKGWIKRKRSEVARGKKAGCKAGEAKEKQSWFGEAFPPHGAGAGSDFSSPHQELHWDLCIDNRR